MEFVWDGWQAPVAELEAIPALKPLGCARPSIAELWMCVSDGGSAFYLMKNKYSQRFLPPVWVAASCSQLSDLWRKQTCSCRGCVRSRWQRSWNACRSDGTTAAI